MSECLTQSLNAKVSAKDVATSCGFGGELHGTVRPASATVIVILVSPHWKLIHSNTSAAQLQL